MSRAGHVLALDQGTSSTRCIVFGPDARPVAAHAIEHPPDAPRPGWVEQDPARLWNAARDTIRRALRAAGLGRADIAALGVANQRETAVVWERATGQPLHPAIGWQDTRTQALCDRAASNGGVDRYRERTGLPLSTYFTAPKIAWILEHTPGAHERAERGELLAGTVDAWLVWNLTGGRHATDVTNASRTLLMDLGTLAWAPDIASDFGIPLAMLPEIRSSGDDYGECREPEEIAGVPVAAVLGDQQAAAVGQACVAPGTAKTTYGTGNFLLVNTGNAPVRSRSSLLTTVAYRLGGAAPTYALEGAIANTGAVVQWLRDNLGIIESAEEVESLAARVPDCGDVYFVPAFSGLFAPHWRPDARGAIVGLTRFATREHVARSALEAVAFQTAEVVDAMTADTGVPLTELRVDGGMARNDLLMQLQADLLGLPVTRPAVVETTAAGAAYLAGLTAGVWDSLDQLTALWSSDRRWEPRGDAEWRQGRRRRWDTAVERSLDWVDATAAAAT